MENTIVNLGTESISSWHRCRLLYFGLISSTDITPFSLISRFFIVRGDEVTSIKSDERLSAKIRMSGMCTNPLLWWKDVCDARFANSIEKHDAASPIFLSLFHVNANGESRNQVYRRLHRCSHSNKSDKSSHESSSGSPPVRHRCDVVLSHQCARFCFCLFTIEAATSAIPKDRST